MSERDSRKLSELSADTSNLYREETFTDLRAASIRRLTPVKPDGSPDARRPVSFIGETTLVTQLGPLPVNFAIEAASLEEAFQRFPEGVQGAVERLNERASEMARQEASRIVVPTAAPPGLAGGAGVPMPGPGKIILDK